MQPYEPVSVAMGDSKTGVGFRFDYQEDWVGWFLKRYGSAQVELANGQRVNVRRRV